MKKVVEINANGMRPGNLRRLLEAVENTYERNAECKHTSTGLGIYIENWTTK